MKRPGFGVVTLVLVVLCFFGIVADQVRPYIQPGKANELDGSVESFLKQGAFQPVLWHQASEATVALAKSQKKPMLVLIGSSASRIGRKLDATIFNERDVAAAMNSAFICIRIDGLEHPDLANCFLPVTRVRSPLFQGFQCWVLSPDAQLRYGIVSPRPIDDMDGFAFMQMIEEARLVVTGRKGSLVDFNVVQLTDINQMLDSPPTDPQFKSYAEGMKRLMRRENFAISENTVYRCSASLYPWLLASGLVDMAHSSLDRIVFSAQYDWIDGGFFHYAHGIHREQVEFDKFAVENAEMMLALAQVGVVRHDPLLTERAAEVGDWLIAQMMRDDLFASARIGDELADGRSLRNSYSPARLRANSVHLDDDDRDDVNLSSESNRLCVPYVVSRETYRQHKPRIDRTISRLRNLSQPPVLITEGRSCHVSAIVCARMFEVGRLIGSRRLINAARRVSARLESFHDGDDLRYRTDVFDTTETSLSAYLGYSDAMLQCFLATGDTRALDRGANMLGRAELEFQTGTKGVLSMTKPGISPFENAEVPEISDNVRESAAAMYIRLLASYGRILGEQESGVDLVKMSIASARSFGVATDYPSAKLAGFFRSAAFAYDPSYAVVVGPKAGFLSDELVRRVPSRLVYTARDTIRRDFQARTPGIYVVNGPSVTGPFSVEEAASQSPLELRPSKQP